MIKEKAMKHQIRLSTRIDNIPDTIIADERKIKQVMYNLLSNAIKFTLDNGKIELSANVVPITKIVDRLENGPIYGDDSSNPVLEHIRDTTEYSHYLLISVSDTGIGIKNNDLKRIFNPFEQVESSSNRRFQGTGLGLSLCRQFISLHMGILWVESEGENCGSKFSFAIPIYDQERSLESKTNDDVDRTCAMEMSI